MFRVGELITTATVRAAARTESRMARRPRTTARRKPQRTAILTNRPSRFAQSNDHLGPPPNDASPLPATGRVRRPPRRRQPAGRGAGHRRPRRRRRCRPSPAGPGCRRPRSSSPRPRPARAIASACSARAAKCRSRDIPASVPRTSCWRPAWPTPADGPAGAGRRRRTAAAGGRRQRASRTIAVRTPKAQVVEIADGSDPRLQARAVRAWPLGALPPALMDGGRRWWLAELASESALRAANPDWDAIATLAEDTATMGLCAFARSRCRPRLRPGRARLRRRPGAVRGCRVGRGQRDPGGLARPQPRPARPCAGRWRPPLHRQPGPRSRLRRVWNCRWTAMARSGRVADLQRGARHDRLAVIPGPGPRPPPSITVSRRKPDPGAPHHRHPGESRDPLAFRSSHARVPATAIQRQWPCGAGRRATGSRLP